MHHSVQMLRCASDYFDHMFLFSDINIKCLRALGVKNVSQILPAADPRYYNRLESAKDKDISFLGQFDRWFNIQGFTRLDYKGLFDNMPDIKSFFGQGLYHSQANEVYNRSLLGLDLPIASIIGPRSLHIGSSSAVLVLPKALRSDMWQRCFIPGEDYLEFEGGPRGLAKLVLECKEKPDRCEVISKRMNEKIAQSHTFINRVNEIIAEVF